MSFGSDVSTFLGTVEEPGLDPTFALISGQRVVLEAVVRRLMTPRGFLGSLGEEWEDYGFDIRSYQSARMTAPQKAALIQGIQQEAMKDERVQDCRASIDGPDFATGVMRVKITISTELGDFSAVLAVSDLTVQILEGLS